MSCSRLGSSLKINERHGVPTHWCSGRASMRRRQAKPGAAVHSDPAELHRRCCPARRPGRGAGGPDAALLMIARQRLAERHRRPPLRRIAFSRVVAFTKQTSAQRGATGTLLDAAAYGVHRVLLSPVPAPGPPALTFLVWARHRAGPGPDQRLVSCKHSMHASAAVSRRPKVAAAIN